MQNTLKLLIPVGFGVAAAILNWIVLSQSTKTEDFLVATADIKENEPFQLGKNVAKTEKGIPRSVSEGLQATAIKFKDKGMIVGRIAKSDIKKGDIILYQYTDIRDNPGLVFLKNTEGNITVPLDGEKMIGASIGDFVWFYLPPFKLSANPEAASERIYEGKKEKVGPFRILAIGNRITNSDDGATTSGVSTVTIAYDRNEQDKTKKSQVSKLRDFLHVKKMARDLRILQVEWAPARFDLSN